MRRVQQVAAILKKELAPMIQETVDQKFGLVTLVDVEVQADLKEAKVFISCFEDCHEKEVLKILGNKTKEYQHLLGRRLKMKFTPHLTFKADRGLENVEKLEKILHQIKAKDD